MPFRIPSIFRTCLLLQYTLTVYMNFTCRTLIGSTWQVSFSIYNRCKENCQGWVLWYWLKWVCVVFFFSIRIWNRSTNYLNWLTLLCLQSIYLYPKLANFVDSRIELTGCIRRCHPYPICLLQQKKNENASREPFSFMYNLHATWTLQLRRYKGKEQQLMRWSNIWVSHRNLNMLVN